MRARSSIVKSQMQERRAPELHGDGVTDDTEGMAWYLNHGVPLPVLSDGRSYRINADRLSALLRPGVGLGYTVR